MERLKWEYEALRANLSRDSVEPKPIPPWVFFSLYDYLGLDCDFGYIFIIDGLDKLGLTKDDEDDFRAKLKATKMRVFNEKSYLAVYIVTMRWDSFLELGSDQYRRSTPVLVADVPAWDIYMNKLRCLEKRHVFEKAYYPFIHRMDLTAYNMLIKEIPNAFTKFVAFGLSMSLKGTGDDQPKQAFELLESIFGSDKRALFNALRIVVKHFITHFPGDELDRMLELAASENILEDIRMKQLKDIVVKVNKRNRELYARYYMVIEALMLLNDVYLKDRYRFDISYDQGKWRIEDKRNRADTDIFLNLFSHPYVEGRRNQVALFLGLRILQYINHNNVVQLDEMADFLITRLGYNKELIIHTLSQMIDMAIIRRHRSGSHNVPNQVELTSLGNFILTHLCLTLEYIALVLENTPIPRKLVHDGLFPLAPYTRTNDFVVRNKLVSAINFTRLLNLIEILERERYKINAPDTEQMPWDVFAISSRISNGIRNSIGRIIDNAWNDPNLANLREQIED
ncbi:MAG: hypothetical protein MUO85_01825, partial [candidate division Zixibacteria bacterium]|nr:hypothetical protein [candidate division Zixibacteria bacterium]